MSTVTDFRADPAAATDAFRAAVERGASLLAGGSRAAGPATPQDDVADLVPAPDAVGLSAVLDGDIVVVVLVTPDLAEDLSGQRDPAAAAQGLTPVVEEIAGALGLTAGGTSPVADPGALATLVAGTELLVASGVFADDTVVATVTVSMAPAGATAPAAAPSTPGADVPAPTPASDGSGVPADLPASGSAPKGPGTAVPPRSATSAAATADAPPAPYVGDAALSRGLSILAEVSLEVTAELGRAALRVSELLDLQPGSIIELDREAGAPVELFVNGTLFARAEVVVVDGQYAVRICELFGGEGAR